MNRKPTRRRGGRHFTQRGAALIAAIVAIAITALVVAEFSTSTNIDMFAAENAENDMKAHFAARSAMNLSRLVIKLQQQVGDALPGVQISDYTGMLLGAFGGSKDEIEALSELVGGFDIDNAKGLGMPIGVSFDLNITTEDGKLNLNCAKDGVRTTQTARMRAGDYLMTQLAMLVYPDAYDPIFQNEDAEGYRRDRETQVSAIIDYIDRDNTRAGQSGVPEDYGYESLDDPYKPKNYPLDSVGEIKQIRGIDDRFWNLFGGNFTVYGGCKINVNALSSPTLIYSVIALSMQDQNDPALRDPVRLWKLARIVSEASNMGFPIPDRNTFKQIVADPQSVFLSPIPGDDQAPPPNIPPELQPLPEGVQLSDSTLGEILSESNQRRTYRVEATASAKIGERVLQKTIVGIWDVKPTVQDRRDADDPKGTWVYWRED